MHSDNTMIIYEHLLTIHTPSRSILSMDTEMQTRPKQRRRVVAEPHGSYTHYLPVEPMERLRRWAEDERMSYSEAVSEAVRIFVAARIQIEHTDNTNGKTSDR